jgi:hypothetical protein
MLDSLHLIVRGPLCRRPLGDLTESAELEELPQFSGPMVVRYSDHVINLLSAHRVGEPLPVE